VFPKTGTRFTDFFQPLEALATIFQPLEFFARAAGKNGIIHPPSRFTLRRGARVGTFPFRIKSGDTEYLYHRSKIF